MKKFVPLLALAASCWFVLSSVNNIPIKTLNVPLIPQQTNVWCWAASGQMTMTYLNSSDSTDYLQCKQADKEYNCTDCCSNLNCACKKPGHVLIRDYGFNYATTTWNPSDTTVPTDCYLSYDKLSAQINKDMPVIFAWNWVNGGGHVMVVNGYGIQLGTAEQLVYVKNPWPPNQGDYQVMTYSTWVGSKSMGHVHQIDFYNITAPSN